MSGKYNLHEIDIYVDGKVKWKGISSHTNDAVRDAALAKFAEDHPDLTPEKLVINGEEVALP